MKLQFFVCLLNIDKKKIASVQKPSLENYEMNFYHLFQSIWIIYYVIKNIDFMGTIILMLSWWKKVDIYLFSSKDLGQLLPQPILRAHSFQPQYWLNRVHEHIHNVGSHGPVECKARFVGKYFSHIISFTIKNNGHVM